ncbi:MAG: type II secretion system F family protein [Candidatus Anstonellales archaeon]
MIFNAEKHKFLRRFEFIGNLLIRIFPFVKHDLLVSGEKVKPSLFMTALFLNALFIPLFISISIYLYFGPQSIFITIISFFYLFLFVFIFGLAYPRAKIVDLSKSIDKDLSILLSDIIIQLKSGVLLYDALVSAGTANYGLASKKINEMIRKISQGYSERAAMQELALTIRSEFMKTTMWRIVSSLRIGGNVVYLLDAITKTVKEYNEREMKMYIDLINIGLMFFLLLGVVLPSIAIISGLIILSASGIPFSVHLLIAIYASSLVLQLFIIGYISVSKPVVMR